MDKKELEDTYRLANDSFELGKSALDYVKFDNNEKINEILRLHSAIGGALAIVPLPGAAIVFVIANVYGMYYRINKELGIPLSKNFVKSIGGMIASNLSGCYGTIAGVAVCETIKCTCR